MANLRMGEIVKVLVDGYGLPVNSECVVTGFNVHGVIVSTVKYGSFERRSSVAAFALRKLNMPKAEMIWNRIRHKEDMISRAMQRWGVKSVLLEPTLVQGEIFKVTVAKDDEIVPVRAGSVGETMKMAFMLGYFMRFSVKELYQDRDEVLRELDQLRETVRVL